MKWKRKKKLLSVCLCIVFVAVLSFSATSATSHPMPRCPGVSLNSYAIDDEAGGADNEAIYNISVHLELGVDVSERVNLSINGSSPAWTYDFSENDFDLDQGDTKNVTLTMAIPDGTTAGTYYVKVDSNATIPSKPQIPPEISYAYCTVTVSSTIDTSPPAPPPVSVPEYNGIGLLALIGILSVMLVTVMRKK